MKTVFTTAAELFAYLARVYVPGVEVDIATYNMYLGISKGTDWSHKFPSPARSFINQVDVDKLRLLLGEPPLIECHPGCQHCRDRYEAGKQRTIDTARMLGLTIRSHSRLHLKYYRVGDLVVVGGINLGSSEHIDASIVVTDWEQRATLMDLFETVWAGALPMHLEPAEVVS